MPKDSHAAPVSTAIDWLMQEQPDDPVFFFDPEALRRQAARFCHGFPGEVTFAVKANPAADVLRVLAEQISGFDVASPEEMALVRAVAPDARLNYHNPIRSVAEVAAGRAQRALSWSVDRMGELDKLGDLRGTEVAVRLKLPVAGGAYDFGAKFGAAPDLAEALLRQVATRGGLPSMTFHPGTQCHDPQAWVSYIEAAAEVAHRAGVTLHRLNVGGGFPSWREAQAPDLGAIFAAIGEATQSAFATPPALVCEPGRAMVADCFDLALRVKAIAGEEVFLNDGIYGGLGEWRDIAPSPRVSVVSPQGAPRQGKSRPRVVFGPTCDSLDRLPGEPDLPETLAEGDYILFHGCGAYSKALATRFNGYGARRVVTLGADGIC